MAAKAMSWNQVCKALSGIGGYVTIDDNTKVRPLELMQSLGVHVLKNSYTPKDIFTAWSERMKKDGKVCIMRSIAFIVVVDGREYTLFAKKDGDYSRVSKSELVPLVSATDKSDKTDVVVNPTNVLRGLQQSVFITATMERIAKSAAKCAAISEGWINIGDKKAEKWVTVKKDKNGKWSIVVAATKKSTKKAA